MLVLAMAALDTAQEKYNALCFWRQETICWSSKCLFVCLVIDAVLFH